MSKILSFFLNRKSKVVFHCSGGATISMDLGHLTLKRGITQGDSGEARLVHKESKVKSLLSAFIFYRFISNRILKIFENYLILNSNENLKIFN